MYPPSIPMIAERKCPITNILPGEIFLYSDNKLSATFVQKYKTSEMWHLITVFHNGKYSKNQIIDSFFELLSPNEFYPCYYQSTPMSDTFFVRKCPEQIDNIMLNSLKLKISEENYINLSLKMQAAEYESHHVDPLKVFHELIVDRFSLAKKSLDLSKLDQDEKCLDFICNLSVPRVLTNILSLSSRRYGMNVVRLNLSGNGLKSARGMHPLLWMKGLQEIDLSNNKIIDISDLASMPKGTITSLWLKGNPVCSSFSSAGTYVAAAKEVLPNLIQIDGKDMEKYSILASQTNFLVSIDAYELTEQFVEFYFLAFDSVSRNLAMKSKLNGNNDSYFILTNFRNFKSF